MGWDDFTYWDLISLIISASAVFATVCIGVYTVKKQRRYAREQAYIASYGVSPVEIARYSYALIRSAFLWKDTSLDNMFRAQYKEDMKNEEQKVNEILDRLRSLGSPVVEKMSDLMIKLKYEFAIETDKANANRIMAMAYILSTQMRSEITSKSISAVKQVEEKLEVPFVTKEEIIRSIIELCNEYKFSKSLTKR